ncbi:hypothetical protein ACR799_09735 [Clavibacter sepedonicus]|uniref:hypothetical protein n=1 Tax=Clavibacter TaxID=1573 RepID=UPI00199BA610|nr:hypothetical protein [Clavibacter sp.]MBD5382727.1 hypothetical protein [Clavibacter sp.]
MDEALTRAGGRRHLDELDARVRALRRDGAPAHRIDGADARRALAALMDLLAE